MVATKIGSERMAKAMEEASKASGKGFVDKESAPRITRSTGVSTGDSIARMLKFQMTSSDVFGEILVCRQKQNHRYRLRWEVPKKPGKGKRIVEEGTERLFTLVKVVDGKEEVAGQATITADWGAPTEATISTWTVLIELVPSFSWMNSHVFLASIFQVCRIAHVQGISADAVRSQKQFPDLETISEFELKFDIHTIGAMLKPSGEKHLKKLREWIPTTSHFLGPDVGWSIHPTDVSWQNNLVGFIVRNKFEKKLTTIAFAKLDNIDDNEYF